MNCAGACALAIGSLFVLTALPVEAAAGAHAARPAVWIAHDTIVDLDNLPERYSCDDLWYKFRGVLLALGARPDLQITLDQCGRSPRVHLRFSLPQVVSGLDTRYASLQAVDGTLAFAAGRPAALHASDCELVRQIKDTLLRELPVQVRSYRLACDASPTEASRYRLSIEDLRPASASDVTADVGGQRRPSGG